MSLDKSLKSNEGLVRQRNVLTRSERLEKLADTDRWEEGDSVFGIPKVRVEKVKRKKAKKEEEAAAEGAEAAVETAEGAEE